MNLSHFLCRTLLTAALFGGSVESQTHTFVLGDNDFLLNGKPFQIIAGEMHFARIPKEYWRHRLRMARAMGLNTIATYVFWNYHEPEQGKFDFLTERRNIAEFIRLAQEESLWVILRPGPYACAEWEFGGYPWWLIRERDVIVRSNDQRFLSACERYLQRLGEEVTSLQITHGGPVIMVQVENEYGSFGNDKEFMEAMRDFVRKAGFDVPLFTADGPSQCRNAFLPDVLPAINGETNPTALKDTVNKYHHGTGPYFSPEFYPGWLDHWGEEHSVSPVESFIGTYDTLLSNHISVSLYMFHGGTNFGFTNGANYGGHYQPQPTSYDYDAPLDEAGRPTPKYFKLREVISKHIPAGTVIPDVPTANPVVEIPRFRLTKAVSLFNVLPKPFRSKSILSMEDAQLGSGYILYRTKIDAKGDHTIVITELRDYGIVFMNGMKVASLDRRHRQKKAILNVTSTPAVLDILVENGGRINFGRPMVDNRKGITEAVTLNGEELTDWEIFPLPMQTVPPFRFVHNRLRNVPAFHRGTFSLTRVGDTFLDMRAWGKGCVWVNGVNLGRFWHIGPQQTLYCPGVWLKKGENEIVILDLEDRGQRSVHGLRDPILDELARDELAPPLPQRRGGVIRLDSATLVAAGSFSPGDSEHVVMFKPTEARYVCLQSLSSLRDDPFASIAELYLLDANGKDLDRGRWNACFVDSEELSAENGRAENAFDDDTESLWHTQWGTAKPQHPHAIAIDTGSEHVISGFRYQPRKGNAPGKIKEYRFHARTRPFEQK